MTRRLLLGTLGMIAMLALAGCAGDEEPTAATTQETQKPAEVVTYKIGVVSPLSGDSAAYGLEQKRALDYYVNDINAKSADTGYKIELVYEDGKCDGATAVTALQKFTDVDGIRFVIGGFCSSESLGMAPLLVEKKALALSAGSSNPDIEGKSSNLFSLSYSDALIGTGIADELGKYKKVALISELNDFNQGLKKTAEKVLKEKYPETQIVANEEFPKGGTDFRNQLDKLKASGAEAVFLNPNPGVTSQAMLKQISEIKDWKVQFISQYAYLSEEILKAGPEAAEGMIVIDAPTVVDPDFVAYKDKIVAANGTLDNLGTFYVATVLDALGVLSDLVAENKGDVDAVQKTLSTETFDGFMGKIYFGGKSFVQGVNVAKFVVTDGKAEMM